MLLVFVVGITGFLLVVSPASLVRNELVRQVKLNTGRDLVIAGPASFTFYPSIGVSLGDVTFSQPAGFGGAPLLKTKRIDVSVALMPLLNQEVLVEHVSLLRPEIDLRVTRDGRASWQFAHFQRKGPRLAQLGSHLGSVSDAAEPRLHLHKIASPEQAATETARLLDKLELRSISITKGSVRYADEGSSTVHNIRDLDLRLSGKRLADPLKAHGGLVWKGERVSFTAHLDTPAALLAERAARAKITLDGRPISAGFDGTVKLMPSLEAIGQMRANASSISTTARWLGVNLPNDGTIESTSATGRMVVSSSALALNGAVLALGETRARGTVAVGLNGPRPLIKANLKISQLDIDRLSARFSASSGAPPSARSTAKKGRPAAERGTAGTTPKSIEDLLRRSNHPNDGVGRFSPQVRGFAKRANEWSKEPINAAALRSVDAKANLTVEGLKVAGLAIARSVMRIALSDGNARIDIDDLAFYGGKGKGVVSANTAGRGIRFGANFEIDNVAAQPLLKDAADFERIAGIGQLKAILSGKGDSEHAIASSLNGTARMTFRDGAIVGWNIPQMIRGVSRGQISDLKSTPTAKTDFSELTGSFTIKNGRATTQDVRMTSPLLRVNGTGDVDIGGRTLDMLMRPKLVGSLSGQGGRNDLSGLEIPVKVHGPWHDPNLTPDIGGALKDPNKVVETVKNLGRKLKGKNVGDLVRGLLGGGEATNGDTRNADENTDSISKTKKLLNQMFQ